MVDKYVRIKYYSLEQSIDTEASPFSINIPSEILDYEVDWDGIIYGEDGIKAACYVLRRILDTGRLPVIAIFDVSMPKIMAKARRCKDGVWDLCIICPFCGKEHQHGGGNGDKPFYGSRLSHCLGKKQKGYFLIP